MGGGCVVMTCSVINSLQHKLPRTAGTFSGTELKKFDHFKKMISEDM